MIKRETLESLLHDKGADGYAEFRDFEHRAEQMAKAEGQPADARAVMRMNHLLTVAMVEAMNDADVEMGIPPVEAIGLLWRNVGVVLASVNWQCFTRVDGHVRQQMLAALKSGYDDMRKAMELAAEDGRKAGLQ